MLVERSKQYNYNTVRLLATSAVTYLGVQGLANNTRYPDTYIMRAVFTAYITMDTLCGNQTPSTIMHHALVCCSAAMCYQPVTGEDHSALSNMLPESCTCEGMAVLSCLDVATGRRFKKYIRILHLLNIALVRRKMWTTCRDIRMRVVKSEKIRMVTTGILNAMLCLDAYWFFTIVKSLVGTKMPIYT